MSNRREEEELEKYVRRSASLHSIRGNFGHPAGLHKGEQLCCWQRCREESRRLRRHGGMLHQEEDRTVRRVRRRSIVRMMILLRLLLGEMMDTVWTRHRQQGEE